MEGFHDTVQQAWRAAGTSAFPLERLVAKFKATARALQSWSQKKVGNVKEQLDMSRELLHRLEMAQDIRVLSDDENWLRRQLKYRSLALASLHRTIVRMRSCITWLTDGDANTEFFHSHAAYRRRKKFISKLIVGDRTLVSHEDKTEAMWEFYNSLLGNQGPRECTLNLQAFHHKEVDLLALDSPISEEEVWRVVKELAMDKAPAPDGFAGRFYKSCCHTIKQDIMQAIGALHGGDAQMLHLLNSAYMVLIPKTEEAVHVGDYRPISLVHSFAKLITKILANRLAGKLNSIVAVNQVLS